MNVFAQEELVYYSRQLVLDGIGPEGQRKLKSARVLVVGVGGLGCQIAAQLATMGVGFIRIADKDVVEASNLQRQHLYDFDVLGYPKVEAAAERLRKMNPFIEIEPVPIAINDWTVEHLVDGVDLVVDGLDRLSPRFAVNRACVKRRIPYVYGAAITHVGNVSTIIPGKSACLACWQSGMDETNIPTCATVGVTPTIISVVASIQVSEAIRLVLGRSPTLLNKLLFLDIDDLDMEKVDLMKAESCQVCGETPSALNEFYPVEEVCGRDGVRVFTITPRSVTRLNLDKIERTGNSNGFKITIKTNLGISLTNRKKLKVSIFMSGCAVIEGSSSEEDARSIYRALTGIKLE